MSTGALLLVLAFPMAVSASSIYRWVDAQGRVHYGDATTAPRSAEVVPLKPGTARSATAQVPTELPVTSLVAASEQCEQAKSQYDTYVSAVEIIETDSLGVERPLNDVQREQLIVRAELEVSRSCEEGVNAP